MSLSEARRFADALASDSKLLDAVKPQVSGLASFVEVGNAHGFKFDLDHAKQLIRSKVPAHQLSDEQLDAIGGGANSTPDPAPASVFGGPSVVGGPVEICVVVTAGVANSVIV